LAGADRLLFESLHPAITIISLSDESVATRGEYS
jgi:hypothetical protein